MPLYGTKIVFDNVLDDRPLPGFIPDGLPMPGEPKGLLIAVAGVMVSLAIVSLGISMVGRWNLTRINKRVQAEVRRRVFDHAVRLPLHRVHKLKSGGVASILSEDAGAVGDLLFAMVYNPWRAIIQLFGCLFILAWTDWRLLLGARDDVPGGLDHPSHLDQQDPAHVQGHPRQPTARRRARDGGL